MDVDIGVFGKGNKDGKLLCGKFGEIDELLVTWDRFAWGLFGTEGHG